MSINNINIKELSDTEVIDVCLNKDINYFNEIVRRYKNLVYTSIIKIVSYEL